MSATAFERRCRSLVLLMERRFREEYPDQLSVIRSEVTREGASLTMERSGHPPLHYGLGPGALRRDEDIAPKVESILATFRAVSS